MESFECPITNCNYFLANIGINKVNFEEYANKTIEQMNNGEIKNFIIHCTSYLYNNGSKSLDVFEMVECFNQNICSMTNDNIPQSISFSNGMIFVFPFDDDAKNLLISIFTHNNARIITNNMNKTISIMNGLKVRFNFDYLIDIHTKLNKPLKQEYLQTNFSETNSLIDSYNDTIFDKSRFLRNLYCTNEPLKIIFNEPYLQRATIRCAAIGIVFLNMVQNQGIDKMIADSKEIYSSFSKLKQKAGCLIVSVYNHFCNFTTKKYIKEKSPFRILYATNLALKNFSTYKKVVPKESQLTQTLIQKLQNELKEKVSSSFGSSFVQIDSYFLNNDDVQNILPQLEDNFIKMEKKTDKNNQIFEKIKKIMDLIGNYIKSSNNQFTDANKRLIDSNIPLILTTFNYYFEFILDNTKTKASKSTEDMIFQSVFHANDDSILLSTPNQWLINQDDILGVKESVVLFNSSDNEINKLLVDLISIRCSNEQFKYPFLIFIVNEDFKSKSTQFKDVITNMNTLFHSYKNYKSSLKQRISVFTPKEMLEFYKKCQNNKLDIFTLTRFCFANIDFNNDISNLLLYGLLSRKINEMEENNTKFPLQLILMSDKHNNDVLALFNRIYLSDYQEQNNDEIKSIQMQIDELDGINSTLNSILLEMIKKMANGTKKVGEILIFTSEPNSNQEILNNVINKVSRCSSKHCKVIPIDYRKHKLLNSKKIHAFNDRLSQFYNLKQKALFVLPINTEVDFQYNKKYKAAIQNPVKNHPNVIKVIITNKPSELSINRLSAVIDISLKYETYYDENDIENKCFKQLPNNELIKRKSLFKSMHPKQYYQIISRNSSYDDEYQNIYETMFKYINLGFSIDELQDLPNKTELLEGAFNNLIKYGLITSTKPYKLTAYGDFINSFEGINILISMAISSVAGYSSKDNIPKNKAFDFKTDNDAKLLLGLLIYHLIKKGNIFLKGLPDKYARYADKRSDLIPMICILCDCFQLDSSKIHNMAPSFGINISKAFPIYKDMTNFINNVYNVVKNQKINVFQKVQRLVNKLFNKDKLYDFIQQVLTEIQNYEPEFINVRRARLTNIQNDKNNLVFIFKGNDSNIKYQKCNRLIIPSNKTSNGFLLHLSKDCLNDQTYGSIYHIDESFILCGLYPYPWLEENKNQNINDDLVIRFANIIAPNCVNFKLSKHRLIFTSDKSVLTPSNNVPLIDDGDASDVIYSYAKNCIKEDKLSKSLEFEFKGFFYRGKDFPKIKEIDQFSQNSSNNCQIWNLGKGCLCVDVKGNEYEKQLKKISDILQKKNIKFNVQVIPLYNAVVSHDIKSKLSNDQFIEKINSIINKFGGIIINRLKYYEETILVNTRKGNASFLLYSSYFAIPLAKMIKNSINNEQEESNEILKIPNDIVDEVILKNPQVFLALNSWFKKNNFNIIHKQNKYIGTKTTVNNVLAKIKIDPPSIPFKSYDIPKIIILEDIYESANMDKKNWYVNKMNGKLIVPSKVREDEVEKFFEENTIVIEEEEEYEEENDIEIIDDDDDEENDIEIIDDDDDEENDIEIIDDDEEEENDIEIIDDDEEEEANEILIMPNSIIIDQVLLNNKRVINILNTWFRTNKFSINGNPPKFYGSKSTINKILKTFISKPPKIPFKSYDIPEFVQIKDLIESINSNKNDWYVNKKIKKLIVPSNVREEEVNKLFNENTSVINKEKEKEEKEIEEIDDYDVDDNDESEDSNLFDFDDEDEDEYEQRKQKNSHNSKIKEVEDYNFKNENEIDNQVEVDEDYENI